MVDSSITEPHIDIPLIRGNYKSELGLYTILSTSKKAIQLYRCFTNQLFIETFLKN